MVTLPGMGISHGFSVSSPPFPVFFFFHKERPRRFAQGLSE